MFHLVVLFVAPKRTCLSFSDSLIFQHIISVERHQVVELIGVL